MELYRKYLNIWNIYIYIYIYILKDIENSENINIESI